MSSRISPGWSKTKVVDDGPTQPRRYFWKTLSFLSIAVCLFLARSPAQTTNGLITGTVTDSSGAVVADAQISVTNQGTGLIRMTGTNGSGTYILPELPPGLYKLSATKTGFA